MLAIHIIFPQIMDSLHAIMKFSEYIKCYYGDSDINFDIIL